MRVVFELIRVWVRIQRGMARIQKRMARIQRRMARIRRMEQDNQRRRPVGVGGLKPAYQGGIVFWGRMVGEVGDGRGLDVVYVWKVAPYPRRGPCMV